MQHADDAAMARDLQLAVPSIEFIGTLDPAGGDVSLSELVDGGGDIERCFDPNATHHAMISSGTTNLPKVSLWTDNNLWFFLGTYARRVGLTAEDVALQIAPANTGSTGYVFPVLTPLLYGASSIMIDSWNVQQALDILESRRPTLATAIPTQMIKMMQDPSCAGRVIDSLRVFTNAGAALAPDWLEQVESIFACRIHTCYSAKCCRGVPAMMAADDPEPKRIASVGRVVGEGGCRLVDESMSDVPAGCIGEVIWRNATKSLDISTIPCALTKRSGRLVVSLRRWQVRRGRLPSYRRSRQGHRLSAAAENIKSGRGGDTWWRYIRRSSTSRGRFARPGVRTALLRVCRAADGHTLDFDELAATCGEYDLAAFKLPESLELFTELPYNTGHKVIKHQLVGLVQLRREQVSS